MRTHSHEQICKDLGISETDLDPCMLQIPVQYPKYVLQRPESRPHKAAACPKKTRTKLKKKEFRQIDLGKNKRAKVAKWTVLEAAVASATGTKPTRSCKSDDVLDGGRRDVVECTRRDLDESDNE